MVPGVRFVVVDVELARRIEMRFRSCDRRLDALIPFSKCPPGFVVVQRKNFSFEYVPAPFFKNESERDLG